MMNNIYSLSLSGLEKLLERMASDNTVPHRLEMMRAVQNQIATVKVRALHVAESLGDVQYHFDPASPLFDRLSPYSVEELEAFLSAFIGQKLTAPQELFDMLHLKREEEGRQLLLSLLEKP